MQNTKRATPITHRNESIIRLYLEGGTLRSLSKDFGVSHERIRQILTDRGIRRRRRTIPKANNRRASFGKLSTREKFYKRIQVVDDHVAGEHWVWDKPSKAGYGRFRLNGSSVYAHIAAYFLSKGRMPRGRLSQTCQVSGCVHPGHWSENSRELNKN